MPFRGLGLVAPASCRQFCAAAVVQKIADGTPALPNPNLDDEACDRRTDPSNCRVKPRLVFYPEQFPPQGALSVHFPLQFQPRLRIRCRDSGQRQRKSQRSHRSDICVPLRKSHRHTWSPALESHFSEFLRMQYVLGHGWHHHIQFKLPRLDSRCRNDIRTNRLESHHGHELRHHKVNFSSYD
jgi:hypothetical protein